jgi:rifampicin phosphotransferase
MKLIYNMHDPLEIDQVGGKAAALIRLTGVGLPVPAFFVVSTGAFARSVSAELCRELEREPNSAAAMNAMRVTPGVTSEIAAALGALPGVGLLAVRSSAIDEDGDDSSFAGQLDSFLFVPPEKVIERIADVWRSGFSERVTAYRRERGIASPARIPAVLVQRMVDAEVSGVAFSADPVSGSRSTLVISSVFGLGTGLVGGEADADTFRLTHDRRPLEQRIARKSLRHMPDPSTPEGVRTQTVPDSEADRPSLTDDELQKVAGLVIAVHRAAQRPQDIEWAMRAGELFLLQSRPITSMSSVADPDGARAIWDNSNIAESYNGITTPLTFSFARHAYEGAYRQFCRLMKVPGAVISDNDAIFSHMLGFIRGRVYYNLLNWYRLLAMLPGFSVNQRFMEQMMGVRQGLPPEIATSLRDRTWSRRQEDRLRLAWSALGLVGSHFALRRNIKAFYARLNESLAPPSPPLTDMRLDQLVAEFRRLESRLLTRWDAPLTNDFLAMIFFGALGKAAARWCEGAQNLQNDLISGEGGIISAEPARRIVDMARIIAKDPRLVDLLCGDHPDAQHISDPEFRALYDEYLEKFGDRCLEELKLESATLVDNPEALLQTIGQAARRLTSDAQPRQTQRPREEAERRAADAMRGHPLRKLAFAWLLHNARARVRDRENLRFERTRLFGRVRRIFVEIGRRLHGEGILQNPRHVFYLTIDEVLGFVEGAAIDTEIGLLAQRRAQTFVGYSSQPPPADRFETRGAVYVGNAYTDNTPGVDPVNDDGVLRGVGCCPGIVRGRVRLIRDPRSAHLEAGDILVAERTDPGWIMLFPAAAGVLVERGSLLSHSAIVARELGIPAIVSIPHLMQSLVDGQLVEMDGAAGTIRIVEPLSSGLSDEEAHR